jgi:hypothetical protein
MYFLNFTDINECSSAPCKNGGICKDLVNGYECACVAGYDGTTCDNSKSAEIFGHLTLN